MKADTSPRKRFRRVGSHISRYPHGFTLVELLVVIAIIGILVALLLPAIQAARESARRTQCSNHLKQMALALLNYESSYKEFPPAAIGRNLTKETVGGWYGRDQAFFGKLGHSWMVLILPQLEQSTIYDAWDFEKNVSENGELPQTDISTFYCPSRRNGVRGDDVKFMPFSAWTSGGTDYGACTGYGNSTKDAGGGSQYAPCRHPFGPFANFEFTGPANNPGARAIGVIVPGRSTKLAKITDGLSQTILLGELQRTSREDNHCSFYPEDSWAIGGISNLFNVQGGAMNDRFFEHPGSEHPGGAQFAMADGSVQFLLEDMDSDSLRALSTMDAGDISPSLK